jgi:type IV secretion system protein VirB5
MADCITAQKLNAFFKLEENDPFAIIGKGYVISTDIKNVVKLRDNIFQIDWDERTIDTRDQRYKIDHMRAVITVAQREPTTEQEILKNPLGIYIIDFNWSPIMAFDEK